MTFERVEIGNAVLYLGDCREILPTLDPVDLILTDPPYGLNMQNRSDGGGVCSAKSGNKIYERSDWDSQPPEKWVIELIQVKAKTVIIWGGNYFDLPPSKCFLIWDKGQRDFSLADGEMAWTNMEKAARFLTLSRGEQVAEGKQHPTQKPTRLMGWCLMQAPSAISILDPFMGSGTTGVAAINHGRSFVGIERDPKYFEIARKRITYAVEQSKQRLFEPEHEPQPDQPELGLDAAG